MATLIFPRGFGGYVWVNILIITPNDLAMCGKKKEKNPLQNELFISWTEHIVWTQFSPHHQEIQFV